MFLNAIRSKWKFLFIILIVLIMLTYHYTYTGVDPVHRMTGRKLMTNDPCSTLEEQIDYYQRLLKTNEDKHKAGIERMRLHNGETRRQLEVQRQLVSDLERRNRQLIEKLANLEAGGPIRKDEQSRLASKISPDIVRTLNIRQENEFSVIPFISFTRDKLYQLEPGMTKRPEEPPVGDKQSEHQQVIDLAVKLLNEHNHGDPVTSLKLVEGYSRTDKMVGSQYDMYFDTDTKNIFKHIQLFRPFAPVQTVQTETYDKRNEWINLIVPLAGRVEKFKVFMDYFAEICIRRDKRVYLTIVYFGDEGKQEIKECLEKVAAENHYNQYKFIERTDSFSRGMGLLAGAEAWENGNVLMFFCDVDIYFDLGYLDRCRLNTAPGKKVYYPIVFSLYNPEVAYHSLPEVPHWRDQLVLRKDSGFWRDFGFGMTCMYRSDFMFMKGFDTSIQGWGGEDVKLYRKMVQSNLEVIRAPDRGIFHLWHEKFCDPHLSTEQYNMCLGSKALSEASHSQLGMLAFKDLREENARINSQQENT